MMKREFTVFMIRSLFLGLIFFLSGQLYAQDEYIEIKNGSFEDNPHRGGDNYSGIRQWYDCGRINFKYETPPDIHPGQGGQGFWDNNIGPSEGKTYLGMVTRENDSWESVSQRLSQPLEAGQCYSLRLDLCQSPKYVSRAKKLNGRLSSGLSNFTKPIVLRVWGGGSMCGQKQLLAESLPINHANWKTYDYQFEAKSNLKYITIEAFYKTPVLFPYNGHLLLDNLTDLKIIPCPEEPFAGIAYPVPDETIAAAVPSHKRKRVKPKKKKEEIKEEPAKIVAATTSSPSTKTTKPKTKTSQKKKILAELDRKNLRKGQTINIEKLFFEADTSAINQESYPVLEEVYSFLNENKDVVVEIGGHTNNIPDHDYCDDLSMQRAREVANFLVNRGIPIQRVKYKGYGKRKPLVSNKTPRGRKKNQRVEIKILSMDS